MLDLTKRGLLLLCLTAIGGWATAEEIGSVDTKFNLLSPDDSIVVEAFDDPDVTGVACHISRAKRGGYKGMVGIAEDPSDASIACRQIGPIKMPEKVKQGEEVFAKRTSIIFKRQHVVRFYDKRRLVLVYLSYSDKIIEGSPKNAISTVPLMPWAGEPPVLPKKVDD